MKEYFTLGLQIKRESFLKLAIPYFSIYTWYYVFSTMTKQMVQDVYGIGLQSKILIAFNFSVVISLILKALFFSRTHKITRIYVGITLLAALMTLFTLTNSPFGLILISCLVGLVFGVTSCEFSIYFINETKQEERGRIGGLVTSITLFTAPILILLAAYGAQLVYLFLCLIVLPLAFSKGEKNHKEVEEERLLPSFRKFRKEFLLYIIPWILLCLNNSTFYRQVDTLLARKFIGAGLYSFILRYMSAGLGAVFFGVLLDWIGRKPIIALEFSLLGLAACLSGLIPNLGSFFFFNIIAGLGWSSLLVLFLLIVWGELATKDLSGIYFSLSLSAYYLSKGIEPLIGPLLPIDLSQAALLNAGLMFISVILLINAKDLLPSEIKDKMRFKLYLDQVKKRLKEGLT